MHPHLLEYVALHEADLCLKPRNQTRDPDEEPEDRIIRSLHVEVYRHGRVDKVVAGGEQRGKVVEQGRIVLDHVPQPEVAGILLIASTL